ncbi:MAG: YcaO-like family protein [Candidatus Woesearchaeota archaeon]
MQNNGKNIIGIYYEDQGSDNVGRLVVIPVEISDWNNSKDTTIRKLSHKEIGSFIGTLAQKSVFPSFLEELLLLKLWYEGIDYVYLVPPDTLIKMIAAAEDLDSKQMYQPQKKPIHTPIKELFAPTLPAKETIFLTRNKTNDDHTFDLNKEMYNLQDIVIKEIATKNISGSWVTTSYLFETYECEKIPVILPAAYNGKGLSKVQSMFSFAFELFERHYSYPNDRLIKAYEENELVYQKLNEDNSHLPRFEHRQLRAKYPVACLYAEDNKLVPAENVYVMFPSAKNPLLYLSAGIEYNGFSTTGLCSGKNPVEAKLQGLLEVIEHYAEMKNQTISYKIDPETVEHEQIKQILLTYNPIITKNENALGVPVFKAQVGKQNGLGAHLNGSIALTRALTEMVNSMGEQQKVDTTPLPTVPLTSILENYSTGTNEGDLERLETLFKQNQISPIYVNLKNKESGIYVYKVIVPELFTR